MKLLKRIKMAWKALTARHGILLTYKNEQLSEKELLSNGIEELAIDYFANLDIDMLSRIARLQMIQSVLSDPSVILQSIHDGKPSVIYDCASREDFQLLLSQDIENV